MFAIAEFGSVTRGSNDRISDRDLLIICEQKFQSDLRNHYEKSGYSVSSLTETQLRYRQLRGSLFIQHLKHESKIIFDQREEFSQWLNACEFIPPSQQELSRCIDTIRFIDTWPTDSRLTAWKADFLYCVSRDFLIKKMASCGAVVFGLEEISQALRKESRYKYLDMEILRRLRAAKAAYRSGEVVQLDTNNAIQSWILGLSEAFGFLRSLPEKKSVERYIECKNEREFSSPYELLRTLEAAYIIAQSHGYTHLRHENLMKCITCPNEYGSSQNKNLSVLRNYLSDIIEILANKSFMLRTG